MNNQREEAGRPASAAPETRESAATPRPLKRPFVEPSVSVPADVLEATALFQAPTVQTSVVP